MGCRPEPNFFVAPSEARGPLALARLGMTSRSADPNEVRDASLTLRRTKKGGSAGQSRGDLFLNSLSRTISFKKVATLFCREKPCPPLGGLSFRAVS